MEKINISEKFSLFSAHWTPKLIGELNGQYVKLAKVKDELVWHSHEYEDEMFLVFKGTLILEFRDRIEEVKEGEMIIVPKGIEHLPRTNGEEVWLMLFEPKATLHTGEAVHEKTTNDQQWI